jgi:hypothetical protein
MVLQEADHSLQIADDVENIALAGDIGKGLSLTGVKTTTGVGDDCFGIEALIDQVQQADAPGVGVAMFLQAKQIAIGRGRVDTHQYQLAGLKYLVVGSDPDASYLDTTADRSSWSTGAANDVVHRAQCDTAVKEVAK